MYLFCFSPNGSSESSLLRKGNADTPHFLSASESVWKLQIVYPSSHLPPTIGFFFPPPNCLFFFQEKNKFSDTSTHPPIVVFQVLETWEF